MTNEKIKALRKQHGLSTSQLGEICGVSPRTVEDWEQGRYTPSKPAMMLLKSWLDESDKLLVEKLKKLTFEQEVALLEKLEQRMKQ